MSGHRRRVVVGLSGGVDSAVAAAELLEQGWEVTGLFMKNWEEDDDADYCAAAEDLADAEAVCATLGIELETVNFAHEYWERVFASFLDEYRRGRTPNPDILCNREIKFREFLQRALKLGADCIATGHYARLQRSDGGVRLCKGADPGKDQTYFLHTVPQAALAKTLFPIGHLRKAEVRRKALDLGLPVHDKKDSTGICFIGERRFREFLARYLPTRRGDIRTLQDEVIGEHQGAAYYTIGQRHGLGIGGAAAGSGEPWFVCAKDSARNILYVVQGHDHPALLKTAVFTEPLHWISGHAPELPTNCRAKTRYRQTEQPCRIAEIGNDGARVEFATPQRAVTPGQSIVFYQGEVCLGGGVICGTAD
ncbi:MAG: tRNA 2-thiouridine(34) synthase MnmA [Pseudomonadota bacterium]|nr:tRNA 2-thiouridine(34) synthase MnmA [Pseudomonadota bacterium]